MRHLGEMSYLNNIIGIYETIASWRSISNWFSFQNLTFVDACIPVSYNRQ